MAKHTWHEIYHFNYFQVYSSMALSIFPLLNDHHNHLSPECFHLSNLKPDPSNIWHSCLPLVPGTRHSTSFLWTWLLWVPHISWVVLYLLTLINNAAMNSQGLFLYRYVFSVLLGLFIHRLKTYYFLLCYINWSQPRSTLSFARGTVSMDVFIYWF